MLKKNDFMNSQLECAKMLGMTLKEYSDFCSKATAVKSSKTSRNNSESENMLNRLGISREILKTRKDF